LNQFLSQSFNNKLDFLLIYLGLFIFFNSPRIVNKFYELLVARVPHRKIGVIVNKFI